MGVLTLSTANRKDALIIDLNTFTSVTQSHFPSHRALDGIRLFAVINMIATAWIMVISSRGSIRVLSIRSAPVYRVSIENSRIDETFAGLFPA